jgi:Winged helix DNA-binding domain
LPLLTREPIGALRSGAIAAERVLTRRELNRALLARQMLLERTRASLRRTLERMGGLQAQYAPSMYIGLWSRMDGLQRERLTRALERRTVVQGTLLRTTIHLVSREDYWVFALAVRRARREHWLRVRPGAPPPRAFVAAARRLRARLGDGALSRAEVDAIAAPVGVAGVGLWLDLVRVPPSGTWERRRADLFGAAERWVGAPELTAAEAVPRLIHRYLAAFGPAAPADIARWAGLQPPVIARALRGIDLRCFQDEDGDELVDLPRAPLPDPDTPAPVRFLPTFDATLLVHARRTGILPEEHRPKIFHMRNPQSLPTFLVDGAVAGAWRHEDGRIEVEPFGRLDAATRRALAEEGERLAAFHA